MGSAEQYMITVKAFISDSHNISCCRLWVQRWALKDVLAKSFLIKTLCLLQTICQKLINTVSYKNTVNNASALQKSRVLTAITSDLSEAPTKLQLETNHFLFSGLFSAFTKLTVILQTSQYGQSYKHQLITVTNWHDATYSSAHWTFFCCRHSFGHHAVHLQLHTQAVRVSSNATSHMAKKSIRPELMQLKTPPSDGCLSVNVVSGALIGARLPGY